MTLAPVRTQSRPSYPPHRRRQSGTAAWLRRVAVGFGSVAALALAGCYGATPFDSDDSDPDSIGQIEDLPDLLPPVPDVPDDIAGGARAPGFECEAPPDWGLVAPACVDGPLCGEGLAWAQVEVATPRTFLVALSQGTEHTRGTVLGPDDEVLAEIGGDETGAVVPLPAGTIRLAAAALDPEGHPSEWITVCLSDAWER